MLECEMLKCDTCEKRDMCTEICEELAQYLPSETEGAKRWETLCDPTTLKNIPSPESVDAGPWTPSGTTEFLANVLLSQLTPQEKEIIELRFGFNEDPLTQEDVAARVGVSRVRITIIEKTAMNKLKRIGWRMLNNG